MNRKNLPLPLLQPPNRFSLYWTTLLTSICLVCSLSARDPDKHYEPRPFGDVAKNSEIPKPRFTEPWSKVGEDVVATTLGAWQMYQQNEHTLAEKKTRPFWVHMQYHGGWHHKSGFQSAHGNFKLPNHYGLWEHNPEKAQLEFRFRWPDYVDATYDHFHDTFFSHHNQNILIFYRLDKNNEIQGLKSVKSELGKYKYTDTEGRIHFDKKTWATLKDDVLKLYDARGSDKETPQSKKFEPKANDNHPTITTTGNSMVEAQYKKFGLSFTLMPYAGGWNGIDSDGRLWVHMKKLYCLDPLPPVKLTQALFLELLPKVMDDDQTIATRAAHQLIFADEYKEWLEGALNHKDQNTKAAAETLTAAMNGANTLTFSGHYQQWQQLQDGKGKTSPQPLTPKENQKSESVETDPLILNTTKAGKFKNMQLVETPIVDHLNYWFPTTGHLITGGNRITSEYFQVSYNEKLEITPRKAPANLKCVTPSDSDDKVLVCMEMDNTKLVVGEMDIATAQFTPYGTVEHDVSFNDRMAKDSKNRLIILSGNGSNLSYQSQSNGSFISQDIKKPQYGTAANLIHTPQGIIIYRAIYKGDGSYSQIKVFRDGQLITINDNIPGSIYQMSYVSKDLLLVSTTNNKNLFFVDMKTGRTDIQPFKLDRSNRDKFATDSVTDKQENFWYLTYSVKKHTAYGTRKKWDGKNLKIALEFSCETVRKDISNPSVGNMCINDAGHIWIGIHDRILVVDPEDMDHRYYRVNDRVRLPKLYSNGNWVMANYYRNPTAFHLRPE